MEDEDENSAFWGLVSLLIQCHVVENDEIKPTKGLTKDEGTPAT